MIADLEWEKGHAFAELFERRSDDGLARDDAVPADADVGQVPSDDGVALDDVLAIQDDVLGAAQHRLPGDAVARSLKRKPRSDLKC